MHEFIEDGINYDLSSRSYAQHMLELSSDDLYQGLLAYGLFAEKLPPVFTSKSFYEYCKDNNPSFDKGEHDFVHYENMRNTNVPRQMAIPNPFSYNKLCKILSTHWENIQQHFLKKTENNKFKVSRIHIRRMPEASHIFEMNYGRGTGVANDLLELNLSLWKEYMVSADISNCFSSIYTHSIPWALVGKEYAKNHRNGSEWYNKIDRESMNHYNGQTNGLPIGPHASNLLSEIILTEIDYQMIEKGWKFIRYIDDYTCYVNSYDEAQKFLNDLGEELREFNLTLNHKKTEILAAPAPIKVEWIRKIKEFEVTMKKSIETDKKVINNSALISYWDNVLELMKRNNENGAIINYAIKVFNSVELRHEVIGTYQKIIMNLAIAYPYLLPVMVEKVLSKYPPEKELIKKFIKKLINKGKQTKNYEAISYSFYFAKKYEISKCNVMELEQVIEAKDCVVLMMAFLYYKSEGYKEEVEILRKYALNLKEKDFDRYWLFVYEALDDGFKDSWQALKNSKISFIKDEYR